MSERFSDRYGREVRVFSDDTVDVYLVRGLGTEFTLTVARGHPRLRAIDTIEAHRPDGWSDPAPDAPTEGVATP